jgi:hypothetical protein
VIHELNQQERELKERARKWKATQRP